MNKNTLSKIKKLALDIDHNVSFAGKSKGNKHLLRVVSIANFLAQKTGANRDIVMASAFLHDTPLSSGDDSCYLKNKKIIANILKSFDLSRDEIDSIAECVASHEGTGKFQSLEAKVVHDADVLEKTGLLGIIRHTWKMTNMGKLNLTKIRETNIDAILNHITWRRNKLQTSTAQDIEKYLAISMTEKRAKSIIPMIADLAFNGVITEKIALKIQNKLNQKERRLLKEQLNLSYLKHFR